MDSLGLKLSVGNIDQFISSIIMNTRLSLEGKQIYEIDALVFKRQASFKLLTSLDLSSNRLTCIGASLFKSLENLEELNLNENKIAEIEPFSFASLEKLRYLNLANNKLTSLPGSLFENLTGLKYLYISLNQLTGLEETIFKNVHQIQELDLSDNRIEQLELELNSTTEKPRFNFSFNNITLVNLIFWSENYQKPNINISSNKLHDLSRIIIQSKNEHSEYMIIVRFNSIRSISSEQANGVRSTLQFDVSKNPLNNSSEMLLSNPNYSKNFITNYSTSIKRSHIEKIDFKLLEKPSNDLVRTFENWRDISNFSVLTGKNGVGKSTVLDYIRDLIDEYYRKVDLLIQKLKADQNFDNEVKNKSFEEISKLNACIEIIDEREGIDKLEFKQLFISSVYRMHDTIKQDILTDEKKALIKNLKNIASFKRAKSLLNTTNYYSNQKAFDIFTADTLDKLALMFHNNEKYVNQHLRDFKYKIRINKDAEPGSQVTFFESREYYNASMTSESSRGVKSSSLSPGEQLMIMFRLWEFALTRYELENKPVLLLDEPDAHLHPEAVCEFVTILKKLADAGAQIIMTTHNPTTVSLIGKESLFCMRKRLTDGCVVFEKASWSECTKADLFRELSPSLITSNVPHHIVLVEGDQLSSQHAFSSLSDALFYRYAVDHLSHVGRKFACQFFFKTFAGKSQIQKTLSELINRCRANQFFDFFGIIDNENMIWVPRTLVSSSQHSPLDDFYKDRKSNVFTLMRHSFENYVYDPVSLFCYLNFIKCDDFLNWNLEVDKTKLATFHKRIATRYSNETGLNISVGGLENITNVFILKLMDERLVQIIIDVMAEFIVGYLTEFDGFNYRLFGRGKLSYLYNLLPVFRFEKDKSKKTDEDYFFNSVSLIGLKSTNRNEIYKKRQYDFFKSDWEEYLAFLSDQQEINERKIKEKEKKESINVFLGLYKVLDDNKDQLKELKNFNSCFEIYKRMMNDKSAIKEFRGNMKNEDIEENFEMMVDHFSFSSVDLSIIRKSNAEIKDKSNLEPLEEFKLFIRLKFKLDKFLIGKNSGLNAASNSNINEQSVIKSLLETTFKCELEGFGTFQYPAVFYFLNGHYLEEVIHEVFFCSDFEKSVLTKAILFDGLIKTHCGYIVPHELFKTFQCIDQFKIPEKNRMLEEFLIDGFDFN